MSSQQALQHPDEIVDTLEAANSQSVRITLSGQPTVLRPSCNGVSYTIEPLGSKTIVGQVTRVTIADDNDNRSLTAHIDPDTVPLPEGQFVIDASRTARVRDPLTTTRPTVWLDIDDPTPHLTAHANLPHEIGPVAAIQSLD